MKGKVRGPFFLAKASGLWQWPPVKPPLHQLTAKYTWTVHVVEKFRFEVCDIKQAFLTQVRVVAT